MSKKQAIINRFFQPKTKDFALSSTPLRIKPRSFVKRSNNFHNNLDKSSSSIVISLLSSDEEDDMTSGKKKRSADQNNSSVNSLKIELKFENEETIQVSANTNTSITDKSDDVLATADFVDVILQEENGSFDMKENPLLEEVTDYKLSSFSSMINWVVNDESNLHLFNEDDWNVIENFKSMSGKRFSK